MTRNHQIINWRTRKTQLMKQRIYTPNIWSIIYNNINFSTTLYGLIQTLINFTPFLLSSMAYFIQKRKNSVVTSGEFLWQIPIVFEIRNFILWKNLKDTIRSKQNGGQNSRDGIMLMNTKIQTFRMYQTFGTSIPSLVLNISIGIHKSTTGLEISSIPTLLSNIFLDDPFYIIFPGYIVWK